MNERDSSITAINNREVNALSRRCECSSRRAEALATLTRECFDLLLLNKLHSLDPSVYYCLASFLLRILAMYSIHVVGILFFRNLEIRISY